MRRFASFALMLVPTLVVAQQHRELGTHEHGVSRADIAIAGNQLLISLEAPGMDVVGFEHQATSPEHRQLIEAALSALGRADSFVLPPDTAECELTSAETALLGEDADAQGHNQHEDHDHVDHAEEHHHDDDDHYESEPSGAHSAFEAEYLFDCAAPQNLTSLTFSFFDSFSNAQSLRVQVVGPSGASGFTVTPDATIIDLSDIN